MLHHKFPTVSFVFLATILLGLSAAIIATGYTLENRSKAEDNPPTPVIPDCAKDTNNPDYCGDSAPFRGCVGGGEWFCQCRLPSGKWWSECSIIESIEEKQRYREKCGGDEQKALLQWKYDMAMGETGGQCSCGGQNVCGSLVNNPKVPPTSFPSPETPIWPTLPPVIEIPTIIPSPTSTYQIPTQPAAPTAIYILPTQLPAPTGIYIPPTNIPYIPLTDIPNIPPTTIIKPTSMVDSVTKPIINIDIRKNIEKLVNFVENTKKSLTNFFSQILP